jgi:hypothetical protein
VHFGWNYDVRLWHSGHKARWHSVHVVILSNFRSECTCISLTGLFKFIACIVNGIMISKCPAVDFNGIMEFKLCIKNKSILNVYLLYPVLHYMLIIRKYPALMGFDICKWYLYFLLENLSKYTDVLAWDFRLPRRTVLGTAARLCTYWLVWKWRLTLLPLHSHS